MKHIYAEPDIGNMGFFEKTFLLRMLQKMNSNHIKKL